MALYGEDELRSLGLQFGANVRVDRSALFFCPEKVSLGSNVRIDAYTIITAEQPIRIGSFVHIAAGVQVSGRAGMTIGDFCSLSPRSCVLTTSDDFVEGYLANPMVPDKYKKVRMGHVSMAKHSILGCASVVLPGVSIGEGATIGALTLVRRDVAPFAVMGGIPARRIGTRNEQRLRELEAEFIEERGGNHA